MTIRKIDAGKTAICLSGLVHPFLAVMAVVCLAGMARPVMAAPEINIRGLGTSIPDNDTTPITGDNTNFGTVDYLLQTKVHTFSIENTGADPLNLTVNPPVVIGGTEAGDFTITIQPATPIPPGGSSTFEVMFDPSAVGLRSAEISISNNDSNENPYNFTIRGTGADYPEMDILGNGVSIVDGDTTPDLSDHTLFGSVDLEFGALTRVFKITNTLSGNLTLTGVPTVSVSGAQAADFTVTVFPAATIATGDTTTFEVTFNPSATGIRNATLTIANNDPNENPYNFNIRGTGITPEINVKGNGVSIVDGDVTPSATDHTSFGSVNIDLGTQVRTYTIENTGTEDMTLIGTPLVVIGGQHAGDFEVTVLPETLIPIGGSTTFDVAFNPGALGARNAIITFYNNDTNENPYNFTISGTGVADVEMDVTGKGVSISDGDTSPSPDDHTDFGNASLATETVVRTFTLLNTGTTDLMLTGNPLVAVSGSQAAEFSVTVFPSPVILPGDSTQFSVTFDPSANGIRNAALSIANSDPSENPYNFNIRGTGISPEMDVSGNGVSIPDNDITPSLTDDTDFGNVVVAGGTLTRTFTITNSGTEDLDLTGAPRVVISGAFSADFSVTAEPTAIVAAGGGTATFNVTFNPSELGLWSATVSIANNDINENPYNFNISGTGVADAEMDVTSNGVSIVDGDASPSSDDHTDFGNAGLASETVVRTFSILNTGTTKLLLLGNPLVVVSGSQALDFTVTVFPSPVIMPGDSTHFSVSFDPSANGIRNAALSIANSDPSENPYNFNIRGTGISPEMDVSGNAVSIPDNDISPRAADHTDFGSLVVAGGMLTRTFTITNTGTEDLDLTGAPPVVISGTHAADFTVTAEPASTVAAGGGTATVDVTFNPSALGLRSAIISIVNDDLNENPYNFSIQGTGTGTPELDILGNGNSIADGDMTPSPADHTDFGGADILYDTVVRTFVVMNTGTAALNLTGTPRVVIGGPQAGEFSVTSQPGTPVPEDGGMMSFQVTFNPGAAGLKSAIVTLYNDDSNENPYDFAIRGTGVAAPEMEIRGNGIAIADNDNTPSLADHTDFGSVEVTLGSLVRTFTILNTLSADLSLTGTPAVMLSGLHAGDFTVTALPSTTVSPGSSTTFQVTFNPGALGPREATISIANNDSDEHPYAFAIAGAGATGPGLVVQGNGNSITNGDSTPSLSDNTDFGTATAGGAGVSWAFTIVNSGDHPLSLNGVPAVTLSGADPDAFSVTQQPALTVPAGDSTLFQIRFAPTGTGTKTATVTIASNDIDNPLVTFSIQGDGMVLTPMLALVSPDGGEVLTPGDEEWIVWNWSSVQSGILEYSCDGGETWNTIQSNVSLPNGSYLWTVPNGLSYNCLVRITATDLDGFSDVSNAPFTMNGAPPVTVNGITVQPLERQDGAPPMGADSQWYEVLADLSAFSPVPDMRVLASLSDGETVYSVTEQYGVGDTDGDNDIDMLPGTRGTVRIGVVALPRSVRRVTVATSAVLSDQAFYATPYEQEITIAPVGVEALPMALDISGFYPNPFNGRTAIRFTLPEESRVTLTIYDAVGRLVVKMMDDTLGAGNHSTVWDACGADGEPVASGVYLYSLTTGNVRTQGKITLMK